MTNATSQRRPHAIIVEDSTALGVLYQQYLDKLDFDVTWANTGQKGLEALNADTDFLLLDLQLPDMHGHEILRRLQLEKATFPRVVITAHGSVESAVAAMRLGAVDFLEKPFTLERLQVTIDNVLDRMRLHTEVKVMREQIERDGYAGFVGRSLQMQVVYRIIDSASASRASVFITGESGTGKELCAEAIHDRSERNRENFVAINCGAIPRELFESEIFGHAKGAFSGAVNDHVGAAERANKGTLFLDEIGEMDLDLQVKLLRFIQTGTIQRVGGKQPIGVDVRFVCATNRSPEQLVKEGKFREDLYYRLNVIPIHMPALREREDDVIQVARHFLQQLSKLEGKQFSKFDEEVESKLRIYDWPGNIRQLHNVIHNIVTLNSGSVVTAEMLPDPMGTLTSTSSTLPSKILASTNSPHSSHATAIEPLWITERRAIESAIEQCQGNVPVAAAHLGVSASTLYRKLKNWKALG